MGRNLYGRTKEWNGKELARKKVGKNWERSDLGTYGSKLERIYFEIYSRNRGRNCEGKEEETVKWMGRNL